MCGANRSISHCGKRWQVYCRGRHLDETAGGYGVERWHEKMSTVEGRDDWGRQLGEMVAS